MAWFGESLSSLSNLKGQITNFTKEVLSEGIVEEADERSKALKEANEKCSQLQDLLINKDAEISLLRRQNCELQRAVIEKNAKESKDTNYVDETEGIFWDPSCTDNRNARNQNHVRQMQEQLAQATMKVHELECELKRAQMVNNASLKDDIPDGHQRAEVLRAKQDMMNRIIQIEEKTREAERNAKRIQLDEATLVNDFRLVISKLNSREKFDLVSGALKALQIESETHGIKNHEKSDSDEKLEKVDSFEYNPLVLKEHFDANLEQSKPSDTIDVFSANKEKMLQKRIENLENENKDLLEAMEKLDQEHTQSIEKLLSLREEINRKYRLLQSTYEQLSIDYNEAQKKMIELQNNSAQSKLDKDICTETNCQSVQVDNIDKLDKYTQVTFSSQEDNSISETNVLDDITQKVKAILKNHTISNVESGESIFEAIAKQYVDAKWKLDILERKVTEVTRDLKETEEIKDALQIDCDELQSHINSLLLESQALRLPSIPEASEERVASLETDVESLQEEVKRLLIENKAIRDRYSALTLVVQSKGVPLINSEGDVNSEVYPSIGENGELQKNIGLVRDMSEQMREISTTLKQDKNTKEDIVLIEQLKLDHENVKRELSQTISNTKMLEINLAVLQDTINKLTVENENLLQKNKHMEIELYNWQERLQKENNCLVDDLQKQLNEINREKCDLQNDILYKEKELDEIRAQIDIKQLQVTKLNQDNDRLIKENISLSEQLTATHDESLDKIELLNTEMTLLQQEYADLEKVTSIHKEESTSLKEKLRETQECYVKMENEYRILKIQYEQLGVEKENIQSTVTNQISRIQELESELSFKMSLTEQLKLLRNRCERLEQEIEEFGAEKTRLSEVQEDTTSISLVNLNEINNKRVEERELHSIKVNLDSIENTFEHMRAEKQDLLTKSMKITPINQQSTVNEEKREENIVTAHNEKLMDEIIELRNKLQIAFENNKESAEMAKQTIEDLSHLIRDKDNEMSVLQAEITHSRNVIAQISNDIITIKKQRDELEQFIAVKNNESLQYQNEIRNLIQRVNEQAAHIQSLINEQMANELRNKANMEEQHSRKLQETQNYNEIEEYSKQRSEIATLNEKCGTLEAALMQEQSNNRILQDQLTESQNKEINAARELERLRTHLVEMESNYTEEAVIAEKSREELEARLLQVEEKMKNNSTAYTSANIRANQQLETLQQQMALIIQQRDQIQTKLSAAEDKILQQSASLTNLQIVLEQFQQNKERDIMSVTEKIRSQLDESYRKQEELINDISILKQQLSEAKECLQAASRLSEQLEKKDEQIERLNEEVAQLTTLVNSADQRIKETMERDEGKVDKTLIKNLLLGYLSSTTSDKSSILRVFATVLDFTESEKDKTGLSNATTSYNCSLRSKNGSAPLKGEETSLSMAFVRFLESESKPKPQLPALPIVNSSSSRPGYNKQSSSSSSVQSTLLSNVALPTFPDFIPARNTGSILKEVLKDS